MFEQILELSPLSLTGYHVRMSLIDNQTQELWKSFMESYHKKIENHPRKLYSVEVYDSMDYFNEFNPHKSFEKYAMVDSNLLRAAEDNKLTSLVLKGKYAVFLHKGPAHKIADTYGFIINEWLKKSSQILDNRPFFSIMNDKYLGESPKNEERIYIPIQ